MMLPSAQARIVQYIEQNRHTYTEVAITQQLIGAGYQLADIQAAWRFVAAGAGEAARGPDLPPGSRTPMTVAGPPGGPSAPSRQRVVSSPAFWLTMIGFILASYILPGLLLLATSTTNSTDATNILTSLSGLLVLLIGVGGLIGGLVLLGRNRPVAIGLLIGLLLAYIVLPFVAVIIVFGICVFLLSGFNTTSPP